jgi:hexosaminidase
MRRTLAFFALLSGARPFCGAALMPFPAKLQTGAGGFPLTAGFSIETPPGAEPRLAAAASRTVELLSRQTGIRFTRALAAGARRLVIECGGGPAYPALGEDESYTLDIGETGALLRAATVEGALHGLATFAQLVQTGPEGFQVPFVHIEDRPRFPWRGLLLDVCRHWMPPEVVKRNLDAMAAVKLNVLHWHLSEDQGFRVESRKYPRLHEMGSNGDYYTQAQVREIDEYARERGIRVVPEFDMPGHTTAWFAGYPELASAPGPYAIETKFGVLDPAMDPTREEVYEFLDGFIGEMAQLFPDPYFHIGGDEVNGRQWRQSQSIQAFMKTRGFADAHALQADFNRRLLEILGKYRKIMIGWDEILGPDLPKDAVIQSWRGQKSLAQAATEGRRAILSAGYYLDYLRPASYHYSVDPLGAEASQLTPQQASLVLGGEACMWAELVNAETVDSRVWPRAAVIAERLWSPKDLTDVESMYDRVAEVSRQLEWTGVKHRANYEPMLGRLAGGRPSGPLRVVADVSEARGLGTGRSASRNTTATPLNRFVDAARPESETVRALEQAARRLVLDPVATDAATRLRDAFTLWAGNDIAFQALAQNNQLLAEVQPLSKDLSSLGAAGLRMLDALIGNGTLPPEWLAQQASEIARLQKPVADVLLAAARPVKILLDELNRRQLKP